MIGVDEALELVLAASARSEPWPVEQVDLDAAAGRILGLAVIADRDMPPFTRSAMDGYAVRSADTVESPVSLQVVEEIPAGRKPSRSLGAGQASKIMTGAALPEGADAVQMVEKTRRDGDTVMVLSAVARGEHVRRAGEDLAVGSVLLEAGDAIGPAQIGLLASAGHAKVTVSRRPRVAIIPTGDELVPVDREPGPTQIRESNGRALEALVRLAGAEPDRRPIVRDAIEDLRATIGAALQKSDVVLLSGGVSMGDYDLVGAALADLGCRMVFDRVAIQPGKPLWFGRWPRPRIGETLGETPSETLVFGLPGNPVSTVVDFLVFARPALRRLVNSRIFLDATVTAPLAEPLSRRPGRRSYLPAVFHERDGAPALRLLDSRGSADMVALAKAEALAIIPQQAESLEAGFRVRALPLAGLSRA